MKMKYYDFPVQVSFFDEEGNVAWGIGYRNEIICACCGSTFETGEVEIIREYEDWVNFTAEIAEM